MLIITTETTTLSLALKYMTEVIAKTSPLSDLIFKQLNPPANSSDSDLYDFVQHNLFSSWHPCGMIVLYISKAIVLTRDRVRLHASKGSKWRCRRKLKSNFQFMSYT